MRIPVITGSYKQFKYFADKRHMEGNDYFYCSDDMKLLDGFKYDIIVLTGDWWNSSVSIKLAESCLSKIGQLKEVKLL